MRFLTHRSVLLPALLLMACTTVAITAPTTRVTANSKPAARGKELFATKGCAHCHGDDGVNGERGPDLQLVRKRLSRDLIAKQIHDGGAGMPAYGDQLTAAEQSDLVAYLEAKRKHIIPAPPVAPTPKPDPDQP